MNENIKGISIRYLGTSQIVFHCKGVAPVRLEPGSVVTIPENIWKDELSKDYRWELEEKTTRKRETKKGDK